MGPGIFDAVGRFITFCMWTFPVLAVLAAWKVADLIVWSFHHINVR